MLPQIADWQKQTSTYKGKITSPAQPTNAKARHRQNPEWVEGSDPKPNIWEAMLH